MSRQKEVTWAEATRDIVICAIDRGQLPTLLCCAFVLILLIRIPSDQLGTLLEEVGKRLANGEAISWILLPVFILGWFFHTRWMRKKFTQEYERIGKEKSALQEQLSGVKLKSSEE